MTAFVGLGSNLDNPREQLQKALQALRELPQSRLLCHSSFYQNPPLTGNDQPDYLNAVAGLTTHLSPETLLQQLQQIENQQGRQRQEGLRWAARTLDLDLLLYGEVQQNDPRLTLPHHGLYQRDFVLYPLYECVPDLILPNGQRLAECVEQRKAAASLTRV
ncbi:2-amino-4-hydroxy-6-hydroxymethyldihydropteridine diphosphokinase [Thioflexithrix psekupsensis]|uniref:2-amino-4-hydroxy-6-hydroxymethyldihydropteridine pyrophosphokinase n=1 Tax=Thioflexithrix psekupsensis TaxID=1570016 RepID=A0A251XBU2_9GAMM|nr:2-amino-4-hydroxy-6-hydroxymethyldihydropteridine diphosphokinase [Thioflexithrix psekupsensis]